MIDQPLHVDPERFSFGMALQQTIQGLINYRLTTLTRIYCSQSTTHKLIHYMLWTRSPRARCISQRCIVDVIVPDPMSAPSRLSTTRWRLRDTRHLEPLRLVCCVALGAASYLFNISNYNFSISLLLCAAIFGHISHTNRYITLSRVYWHLRQNP